MKNWKKREKIWVSKKFLQDFPSKGLSGALGRLDAGRERWRQLGTYDPYRSFAGHEQHLMSQIRFREECLIPTDNTIVLVWHFSFTKI